MKQHRNKHRGKRNQDRMSRDDQEEYVDDLAHAAQFAVAPMLQMMMASSQSVDGQQKAAESLQTNDADEIDVDDDDEDDEGDNESSTLHEKKDAGNTASGNPDENDSSDDESEVDLLEAISRMQDGDGLDDDNAAGSGKAGAIAAPPKTENELIADPYHVPLEELEQAMKIRLTVDSEKDAVSRLAGSTSYPLAGTVMNHMAENRTLIIQSAGGKTDIGLHLEPLDEGSLLVLCTKDYGIVPLGKIFEIFGPISQPLYSIRLPAPPAAPQKASPKKDDPQVAATPVVSTTKETTKPSSDERETMVTDSADTNQAEKMAQATIIASEGVDSGDQQTTDATGTSNANVALPETTTTEQPPPPMKLDDPWSVNGEYTLLLKNQPRAPVYTVQEDVRRVDTRAIIKLSGKGCDASNLYDEEVLNANDIYYSDDEKERQAKGGRRKGRKDDNNKADANAHMNRNRPHKNAHRPTPHGFHNVPQGFHAHAPRRSPPPPPPTPQGFYAQGAANVPPPPPPPQPHQGSYPNTAPPYHYGIQPPTGPTTRQNKSKGNSSAYYDYS